MKKLIPVLLSSLLCIAMAFVFGRCSPIASSVSKSALQSAQAVGTHGSLSDSTAQPSVNLLQVNGFQTRVIDSTSLTMEPPKAIILNSANSGALVEEFRRTGELEIQIDSLTNVDHWVAEFEVSLSAPDISARNLSRFRVNLVPTHDNLWRLEIVKGVSPEIAQQVRDHLIAISLGEFDPAVRIQ